MKILPITMLSEQKQSNNTQLLNKHKSITQTPTQNYTTIVPLYNDYLLSFGARVDKGLERFYEVNKDIMPTRVREHIESLEDKSLETPLEAQRKAYERLGSAQTVQDLQEAYSDFASVKPADKTKATSGILYDIREFSDLLAADGKGVLKNKKDLSVYLVQKIFLENLTLEEINQALEEDLEPEFKSAFKFNNEDAQFIHHSTLQALGIKAPDRNYRQSLRYTRDGYSDMMGEKITNFWNSLSDADRTARARKSVISFENWWVSIPQEKKLDLLLEQDATLTMLQKYREARPAKGPKAKDATTEAASTASKTATTHAHVGSAKLSQDELFVKWATNNLQIFKEGLSDFDKSKLEVKRTQALLDHWGSMSAAERTNYIAKLKTGQEPLRYAMIDAWNHSFDILKDLSEHLSEKHIERGIESIYAPEPFSEFQSRAMTEFWETHPQHAEHLGEAISNSNAKVKDAMNNGRFERLKQIIMQERSNRIKMLKAMKAKPQVIVQQPVQETYMDEFRRAYLSAPETASNSKNLPKSYMKDYFRIIEENFDEPSIRAWTKNLKGEHISEEELNLLRLIMQTEPEEAVKMNRALEATLGMVLYENTGNPEVFKLTYSDMKVALAQLDRKEREINIFSHNLKEHFQTPVRKHKINRDRIETMYNSFMKPLKEGEMKQIIHGFFKFENEEAICIKPMEGVHIGLSSETEAVEKYLQSYGQAARLIFSPTSTFSDGARSVLLIKFIANMPENCDFMLATPDAILRENSIKSCNSAISRRFDFIPKEMLEPYSEEVARDCRFHNYNFFEMQDFTSKVGRKRTNASEGAKIAILPKQSMSLTNRFKMLSAEQILAERLYESTKNPSVFALHFEELCDKLEVLNLVKKFPSEQSLNFTSFDGEPVSLNLLKRPDFKGLATEFAECCEGVVEDWFKTEFSMEGIGKLKTLVENLANGETNPQILKNIERRISHYKLPLRI